MTDISLFSERVILTSGSMETVPALVSISDGVIQSVQRTSRDGLAPDASYTDLGDHLLTPAFINGHTHLSMSAFRGIGLDAMDGNIVEDLYFRLETSITAADVRAFTRMAAYESLLAGVGTVWDHYYHAEAVADALVDVGLTGVVAPTLQDLNGPGVPDLDAQLAATERIATSDAYRRAGVVAALGPHATDTVSDSLWATVGDLADRHALFIHSHVAQSVEEYVRSVEQHGCSPIERLDRLGILDAGQGALLVHGLFVDRADLARLRPERNILGYCPFSQVQFCFPAAVEEWWNAGAPVILGTDCGACNDTMNVQQELRLMANGRAYAVTSSTAGARFIESNGLSEAESLEKVRQETRAARHSMSNPRALLDTVWRTPGQMHQHLPVGDIAPGYRANLTVWDLEHPACWPATDPLRTLTMSDVSSALWGMMINGEWRGEPGRFRESILLSDNFHGAREEADGRLKALLSRLSLD
jgi:5-methylthioadenosine/S-adenosylhomocysteine deaminase